jgi:hypothetical protein
VALVLESWGVVARRAAVEATLPGGLSGWFELAPNRAACADGDLCVVAFMAHRDAAAFAMALESRGLSSERDGEYRDVAIVGTDGVWQHACSWLRVGHYAGVRAVWMDGADPDPLVVPLVYRPNSLVHLSAEEVAKRLKFLRREGPVEVYLDTETGEEMYHARTSPPDELEPDVEQRFRAAADAIQPLLTFDGHAKKLGWFERRRLAKGIRQLEELATGDRWRVWWTLGMARRAASDPTAAFEAFERAYDANPAHADVSREFGAQCLTLGLGSRAVTVCERNCSLHPTDAGLRANLALACVVADDLPRAKVEAARALEMDPSDEITRALAAMIDEVIAGTRPRMTKYP